MNLACFGVEMGESEIITQIKLGKGPKNEAIDSGKDGTLFFDNKRRNLGKSQQQQQKKRCAESSIHGRTLRRSKGLLKSMTNSEVGSEEVMEPSGYLCIFNVHCALWFPDWFFFS